MKTVLTTLLSLALLPAAIHLDASQNCTPSSLGSREITGKVVDADGKPAPNCKVSLFPFAREEKLTDAEGRFTLALDLNQVSKWPNVRRVVLARDPARNLAAALDLEDNATNANLRLGPALTLTGRVIDANSKALTNAQAQVTLQIDRMEFSVGQPVSADAAGRFEIKGLPTGRDCGVNVSANGYSQESRQAGAPDGEALRIELDAVQLFVADQRIAGVVVNADDKPVSGARIIAYGTKQPHLHTQTDSKGRFTFERVCAGNIRLWAYDQGDASGGVTAKGGDTNIVLQLRSSPGQPQVKSGPAGIKGKPLPELATTGLSPADAPAGQPVLALLIDAGQRPSRRAVKALAAQASALKQRGVAVVVIQASAMAQDAFGTWKQESALPFPVGCLKADPDKARAAWGAGALPWLILTDKGHRVIAEGFALEELEATLKELSEAK